MLDYIKLYLLGIDWKRLMNLECLDFKNTISETTGEISTTKTAEFHLCKIIIKQNSKDINNPHIIFKGSIHKMWNSLKIVLAPNYSEKSNYSGYNGNLFTLKDVIDIRTHLEELFDCNASQMIFENIELGVNTTLKFEPILFLKGLLYHQNKPFEYQHNENYSQVKHNRFFLKLYNKSLQYGMTDYVLRFEIKTLKMLELKRLNIKAFADINEIKLNKVKDLLLQRFDEIVYYDYTIRKTELKNNKRNLLSNYSNPRYWLADLKSNHRNRPKQDLKNIIVNHSDNLHLQIRNNIIEKCVTINHLIDSVENSSCVINNRIYERLKITHLKKCLVTGIDISNQKNSSLTISENSLKKLYRSDILTLQKLKNKYLPKLWINANLEKQLYEIAHNIRNVKNNAVISQNRIPQEQGRLEFCF